MSVTVFQTREEWLFQRASGVGASESAILYGAVKKSSPYSLWALKTGAWRPDRKEAFELDFGHDIEPLIATYWEREAGMKSVNMGDFAVFRDERWPWMFCTPDILAENEEGLGVVQMKAASHATAHEWRNGPPLKYIIQVQHEMAVTGAKWGHLAVLFGSPSWQFKIFPIARVESFQEELIERTRQFWKLVEEQEPPDADTCEDARKALSEIGLTPFTMVDLPPEFEALDQQRSEAIEQRDAYADVVDHIDVRIREAIGTAEFGLIDGTPVYKRVKAGEKGSRLIRLTMADL